ncbi:pyridoxine-5'-phosphate oxidase isoform X1 [Anabrus simplex]|uniref:pyridoxine-5'-phosphate oxidase isoform X1 n=1 Tax=Anabrus simplex TaxID=316456 RepID=UPI0035A2DBAC
MGLKVLKETKESNLPRKPKVEKDIEVQTGAKKKKFRDKPDIFTENDLVWKEPLSQFRVWFDEASQTPGIGEASVMCLATASKDGIPSGRLMLLKSFTIDGFKFYTNYESRKGRDLEENPRASLAFFWEPLDRQVRVHGKVEKISKDESDKYFADRPRDWQIATWASRQTTILAGFHQNNFSRMVHIATLQGEDEKLPILQYINGFLTGNVCRQDLMERVKNEIEKYKNGKDIPRPDFWGGYILLPETVEFWQGQTDRLHDRIVFRRIKPGEEPDGIKVHRGQDDWVYERLSP